MSEILERGVEYVAELPNALRGKKPKHDLGITMTRICLWLIVCILTVIAWTGNHLLDEVNSHLVELRTGMDNIKSTVTVLQVDMAVLKQKQTDMGYK